MNKKLMEEIAFWIVIFGAIDMGLYALLGGDADIINTILTGGLATAAKVVEAIIGIAAVYLVYLRFADKKADNKKN